MTLFDSKAFQMGIFNIGMASLILGNTYAHSLPEYFEYEFEGPSIERVVDNTDGYDITLDTTDGAKQYTISKKELANMLEWDGTIPEIKLSETEKISATTTKGLNPLLSNSCYVCGGIVAFFGAGLTTIGIKER